jgi:rsbT co-antagonist protein RsbR
MNPDLQRVASVWRNQSDSYAEKFTDELISRAGPSYGAAPREQMLIASKQIVNAWATALETGNDAAIREVARQVGHDRARTHFGLDEIMRAVNIIREELWRVMMQVYAAGDWDMDVVEQIEHWLHNQRSTIASAYGDYLHEMEQQFIEREQALEAQSRLIQELSAPIVPLHEGILVLPLVGAVDSRRASQIMEAALEQIVAYQADVLILDITGVPVVDTGVANYVLQMARAVTLLGSKVILVGIGAEIAQTIVQLGVELHDITTLANLQAGIAHALTLQGFAIQEAKRPAQVVEIY